MMDKPITSAVGAVRNAPRAGLDDYPTPAWAVRALFRHVLPPDFERAGSAWEPACNRGSIVRALFGWYDVVTATDIHDYGYGQGGVDFLMETAWPPLEYDIITNPPFTLTNGFALKALTITKGMVALFCRLQILEGVDRYTHLFGVQPPDYVGIFAERVPLIYNRLDPTASSSTAYCWLVWDGRFGNTQLRFIPPCRRELEKPDDYPPQIVPDTERLRADLAEKWQEVEGGYSRRGNGFIATMRREGDAWRFEVEALS